MVEIVSYVLSLSISLLNWRDPLNLLPRVFSQWPSLIEEGTSLSLSLARAISKEKSKLHRQQECLSMALHTCQSSCASAYQNDRGRERERGRREREGEREERERRREGGERGVRKEGRNRLPSLWSSSSERDWQMNDSTERRLDNDHTWRDERIRQLASSSSMTLDHFVSEPILV